MDANGTHYHLLLGADDWGNCTDGQRTLAALWAQSPPHDTDADVMWQTARNELTLRAQVFKFVAGSGDTAPDFAQRRGAARDRYGNWYWIDDDRQRIRVNSVGTGNTTIFWPDANAACAEEDEAGSFQPRPAPQTVPQSLSGLAVTEDHFLVVGTLEPRGLLVFDLHAGGEPRQLLWPRSVEFVPWDMAARPGGGVLVLDRVNRCYWALDRRFNVVDISAPSAPPPAQTRDGIFRPRDPRESPTGAARACEPLQAITAGFAAPLDVRDPVSLEALPDGAVLILDFLRGQNFSLLHCYRGGARLGVPVSTDAMLPLIEQQERARFRLVGHDITFVAAHAATNQEPVPDRLYVVSAEGNQSFAFNVAWPRAGATGAQNFTLDPVPAYLPMRLFGGKGLVAAGTDAYYDFADRWIPLVEQRRPRFPFEATIETPPAAPHVFDGREPDCVWHRLMLDACLAPETRVEVWSRAANDLNELTTARWLREPALYLRGDGSELPFARGQKRSRAARTEGRAQGAGTWELLFQRTRGRYLQLRLRLVGNGRSTPRLRALRAYYPRFSYLARYLPAVYREDEQSASFLDRFLANVEGLYTTLEDKIAAVQMLFDVRSAPTDALDWLATWLGVALDPAWDEAKRRLFIKHAAFFFQYRGTTYGLELALRLALDDCVDEAAFTDEALQASATRRAHPHSFRLVEKFRARSTYGVDTYGATTSSAASTDAWRGFLARRYRFVGALNAERGTRLASFADAPLPTVSPAASALLADWTHFESLVLAMRRTAHQFTVLLPIRRTETFDSAEQRRLKELTTRIIELEKPAHTVFDVRFYWAMFRVGEVRLGDDTLLDHGSRSAALLPPMVLGQEHLAESYLAPGHPQDVCDRQVLGRG